MPRRIQLDGDEPANPIDFENPPDTFDYLDYNIIWTGWERFPASDTFTAFWLAYGLTYGVYSCTGGIVDRYLIGDVFNVSHFGYENYVNYITTPEKKARLKREALVRLILWIDEAESTK